ncbi:MAG: hypothetical protein Q7J57_10430 [Gemmobacter sp.]|nr:hypothetical protein [Gemmobacter sp.]
MFGHDIDRDGDGVCEETSLNIGRTNTILDFDGDQGDRVVFHTDFEGTLSAAIEGDDVRVTSSLGGDVLIKGLVSELEGIDPTDPFFNPDTLMEFLIKTGTDGDGKGIIYFEDKCVTMFTCEADQAEVDCYVPDVYPLPCCVELSEDRIGNTTISTTELQIAQMFVEQDANVSIYGNVLCIDLLAEPQTI